MKHFISYPFWINEVACWSDLKSLNGPVGTENRGVAVFTHWDITQLNESTFVLIVSYCPIIYTVVGGILVLSYRERTVPAAHFHFQGLKG